MSDLALSQIEKSIDDLSTDEQLRLISRVAEKLRKSGENGARFDLQLEQMAADEAEKAALLESTISVAGSDPVIAGTKPGGKTVSI